jgi:FkbM family methyltransferase
METLEQELSRILSASRAEYGQSDFDHSLHPADQVVLYGAGGLGTTALKNLRRAGVNPVAFADDTPEKQGKVVQGLPVMTPAIAVERFGERLVFVVTIMNPKLRFLEARRRLKSLTNQPVLSFLHVARKFPQTFLPYYQFELPEQLLAKSKDILAGFHLWADDESRQQFVAHIRFRLDLDYEALPRNTAQGYLPSDLFSVLPEDVVFIDCGAYDGDTVRQFVKHQGSRFKKIYAFEPDEENCRRLRNYVAGLDNETSSRVEVHNAAVGDSRGKIGFSATGDMSASFTEAGATQVDVLPLDEVVMTNGSQVFLKFDVEGAELAALSGAERLIRQARPLVALSVYHRPDDLWQLPLHLNSLAPGYSFFLRTQGEDGMDVICYAVPPGFPPPGTSKR